MRGLSRSDTTRYFDFAHVEKLDRGEGPAVQFLNHLLGIRSLDLISVADPDDRLSTGAGRRSVVLDDLYVVASGFGMELNPVSRRRPAHEHKFILFQVKEDSISDDIAIVAARNKLLRLIDAKI